MTLYHLNPDLRTDAPTGAYCCRCQKPLKGSVIQVTVDWDTWRVAKGWDKDFGGTRVENLLVGPDCWREIAKRKVQP